MASSSSGEGNIRFIAVARVSDHSIVATHGPKIPMEKKTRLILDSRKYIEQNRLTINDSQVGTIHYEYYGYTQHLYLVVTSEMYPQRVAFEFLGELSKNFEIMHKGTLPTAKEHGLTRSSCKLFLALVQKYQHPHSVDKVASVSIQVQQVKGLMQDNIRDVLGNRDNISHLVDETANMAQEASQFQRTAQVVHNNQWWKNMKWLIGIIVAAAILLAVIGASFMLNSSSHPIPSTTPKV